MLRVTSGVPPQPASGHHLTSWTVALVEFYGVSGWFHRLRSYQALQNPQHLKQMKTILICTLTAVLTVGAAQAQTVTTTTTTAPAYTTANGTVTTYAPGKDLVIQEATGPVSYVYNPDASYIFKGIQLTPEQAQARIRAGLPVKVEYAAQGNTRVVKRIIVDEDSKVEVDADDDDDEVEIKVKKD